MRSKAYVGVDQILQMRHNPYPILHFEYRMRVLMPYEVMKRPRKGRIKNLCQPNIPPLLDSSSRLLDKVKPRPLLPRGVPLRISPPILNLKCEAQTLVERSVDFRQNPVHVPISQIAIE